jgi:hypothetical protein
VLKVSKSWEDGRLFLPWENHLAPFFTDGAGNKVMELWTDTATCETRNLYLVEELHNSIDQ